MRKKAGISKKVLAQFSNLRIAGCPPVLECCLYDNLNAIIGAKYSLRSLDVRCIMLVATFEGAHRWEIIERAALHRKSIYTVFDRLQEEGYIYTPDTARERGQRFYLSLSGKNVVFDFNALWGDLVKNTKRRGAAIDQAKPQPVPKSKKRRVRQVKPFTIGKMQ